MSILSQFLAGGVKSIQKGTISITGTNLSASGAVAAVNTAKAFVLPGGAFANVNDLVFLPYLSLANSTTVTATRGTSAAGTTTAAYILVEYY